MLSKNQIQELLNKLNTIQNEVTSIKLFLEPLLEKSNSLSEENNIINSSKNILLLGEVGGGKSTTINSIAQQSICSITETEEIGSYKINNLTLWDTPGFGDSEARDQITEKNIKNLLTQTEFDYILIVVDGSSRDLGTAYKCIELIIKNYDPQKVIIAINQCDLAMKGKGWNNLDNQPSEELLSFLEQQLNSVKNRIQESYNIQFEIMYYSAEYHYNISELINKISK